MRSDIMCQVIVAACLCIAIPPAVADSTTLRYGQIPSTVRSVSTLYLFIAQQKGFFVREALKLELVPIAGGTDKMVAALDQGVVDSPRPPRPT
jgi:ABC-type nitrate/sulfonate/bicarbonate transport system substrate-binding protein